MLFILAFTHDRFIGLFAVVFIAILIKYLVLIDKNLIIPNRLVREGLKNSIIRILLLLRYFSIGKLSQQVQVEHM